MNTNLIDLAIIVPLHNESESINYFFDRLKSSLAVIKGLNSWQVIFVNDGSTDDSFDKLNELRKLDKRVNIISLSRCFGYQNALQAGLKNITAKYYSIIDVDCEDPPELLKEFYHSIHIAYYKYHPVYQIFD